MADGETFGVPRNYYWVKVMTPFCLVGVKLFFFLNQRSASRFSPTVLWAPAALLELAKRQERDAIQSPSLGADVKIE